MITQLTKNVATNKWNKTWNVYFTCLAL